MEENEKVEVLSNDFELIDERLFVEYASVSHIHKVDKFQAKFLNNKYGIKVYWCSVKSGDDKFDAYLVDLGYGKSETIIGSKLTSATQNIIVSSNIW